MVQSGLVDNVGIAVGIAAPRLAVQKLFPRLAVRHLEFRLSAIVDQCRSTSTNVRQFSQCQVKIGRGRKCGVAVGIMSVCCWKLKLHRPAENFRFFHEGCPCFSRSLQILERATFTRKTPKHPELDLLGTGFHRIFKFARVAKLFENT
jgi:hypothetical protein